LTVSGEGGEVKGEVRGEIKGGEKERETFVKDKSFGQDNVVHYYTESTWILQQSCYKKVLSKFFSSVSFAVEISRC
jgi:hypothetical protein